MFTIHVSSLPTILKGCNLHMYPHWRTNMCTVDPYGALPKTKSLEIEIALSQVHVGRPKYHWNWMRDPCQLWFEGPCMVFEKDTPSFARQSMDAHVNLCSTGLQGLWFFMIYSALVIFSRRPPFFPFFPSFLPHFSHVSTCPPSLPRCAQLSARAAALLAKRSAGAGPGTAAEARHTEGLRLEGVRVPLVNA